MHRRERLSKSKKGVLTIHSYPAWSNRKSNPFNYIISSALERLGGKIVEPTPVNGMLSTADIVVINWPQANIQHSWMVVIRRAMRELMTLFFQRLKGADVIWIVHNIKSHAQNRPRLERIYMSAIVRMLTGAIFLSQESRLGAYEAFPRLAGLPFSFIRHPIYGDTYPSAKSRTEARAALGLPDAMPVVGLVGDLKAYKGVDDFLGAFHATHGVAGLIAGLTSERDLDGRIDSAVETAISDGRILVRKRAWLTEEDLTTALAAIDLLVLPYRTGENSGMAILAAERGTPILVRSNAATRELAALLGPGAIHLLQGPVTGEAIMVALETVAIAEEEALTSWKADSSADTVAMSMMSFFERLRTSQHERAQRVENYR